MIKNILFGVSYLGTNYAGWQKQDNALSIQEVIENAFEDLLGKPVEIFASGRTDAGVHAYEQCFNAKFEFSNISKLPMALNVRLPDDIKILWAKEVESNFHARYSAHKKTYVYKLKVGTIESPFDYQTVCYIPYKLNLDLMKKATEFIVGKHNFKAFCSVNTNVTDFVRDIYKFNINQENDFYEFEITGNGFLYNMVRILVGTMIEVGRGKLNPNDISLIMEKGDRQKAGKTMPAKGLFLKSVEY